ncbi:MAG: 6-bladed beta-propeller [Bacteroidales bacterium]|nr:6-bladed beta-propeller [Bacteroidales bacterium]
MRINKVVYRSYYFLIIVIGFTSCSSSEENLNIENRLNVHFNNEGTLRTSDYFDKIEFIPLETTKESMVRYISDIRVKDGRIYAFSGAPDNKINIYTDYGEFISSIGRKGEGPGEIGWATDFEVDTTIVILDRSPSKLIYYSLDGEFLNEIRTPKMYTRFSTLDKEHMALFESDVVVKANHSDNKSVDSKLAVWNYDVTSIVDICATTLDLKPNYMSSYILKNNFTLNDDDLYYWEAHCDTICRLDLNTFKSEPYLKLNMGEYQISEKKMDELFGTQADQGLGLLKAIHLDYAILDNYLIFNNGLYWLSFRMGSKSPYCGFQKTGEEVLNCYQELELDNLISGLIVGYGFGELVELYYDQESTMYFLWNTSDFIEAFRKLKESYPTKKYEQFLESRTDIKKMLEQYKTTDDPMLVKMSFITTRNNEEIL